MSALFHKYHGAGLLQRPTGRPSYSAALSDHSWAVNHINNAVFILRGHSWPGMNTGLTIQIVWKVQSSSGETRVSSHWWKVQGCRAGSVRAQGCRAVTGRPVFSRLCFPLTAVPTAGAGVKEVARMQGTGLLRCCRRISFLYHQFSFVGLGWRGWEATTKMSCCHFQSRQTFIASGTEDVPQLWVNEASKSRAVWLLIKQLLTHWILSPCKFFTSLLRFHFLDAWKVYIHQGRCY